MNKYLLSLFLFGFLATEQMFAQESGSESGGSGEDSGSSGEGGSSGEDSGSSGEDSGSSGEDSGSSGESSSSGGEGSSSGSGGSNVTPNYVVDEYLLEAGVAVPNPYPLDACVQISIVADDVSYAMYTCAMDDMSVTKNYYTDSACTMMVANLTETISTDAMATAGDLGTFVCDGDDYSIELGVDCGSSGSSTDNTISTVPYVCFRDSTSSVTVSNEWECDQDDKTATFLLYSGNEECGGSNINDFLLNGTDCRSDIWTSNLGLSSAIGIKVIGGDAWNCPSDSTGPSSSDDSGTEDSGAYSLIVNSVNVAAIVAIIGYLFN